MNKNPLFIFFISVFVCLVSCREDKDKMGSSFIDLGIDGMTQDYQYIFQPLESLYFDSISTSRFNVELILRYTDKCRFKELPLVTESFLKLNDTIDTREMSIPLFNQEGKVKGKGNYGIYQEEVPFLQDQELDENFFISLSTTEPDTEGIVALGVKWERVK